MKETLLFLSTPMVAGILLALMLGYFGTHILRRGIIFIDIAIAQLAALGTMVGLLLGFAEESIQVQVFSYLLTLLVIGAFAFLKPKATPIPTEAIIGIIYCIGLAMAILLAEKIPGGSNYITKTITGNILWVTWKKVINLGLLFAGMGLIHIWPGKSFNQISDEVCNGKQSFNMKLKLMNLIFYITFGVVVVKTVLIGGIFLVFTLLIAPSAAAALFFQSWKNRLIFSWVMGVIGTVAGIMLSYSMNISNGPAVVCLLGILVFTLAFIKLISPRSANSVT